MDLKLDPEKLHSDIVEQAVTRLLYDNDYDTTSFHRKLEERIAEIASERVDKLVAEVVKPKIDEAIRNLTLTPTNNYGEPKGEPQTFTEFMVAKVEAYLTENVDHKGNVPSGYSREKARARIVWLIDNHLQYSIAAAVQGALKDMNKHIANGLAETCKAEVRDVIDKMKVRVQS